MMGSTICRFPLVVYVLGGFAAFATAQIKTLGPSFQGWSIGASSTRAITCSTDAAFVTSGTYANCCPTTDAKCLFPVSCSSNKIIWDNGGVYECTDAYSCVSMTVFSTSPFGTPSATNIFCATNWEFNSIYRELPFHTTSSASTSTASSTGTTSATPFASLPPSASAGASAWTPWQIILLVIAISAVICIVIYIFRRHKSILKNPEYMELRYWRRKTSVHHVNLGGLASWVWPRRTLGSKGAQDDVELSKSADTADVKYTPEHKAELSSRVSVQGAAPLLMRDSWNTTSTWSVNSVASVADLGELDTARSPRELMVPPAELWDDRHGGNNNQE